jgi:hypothetical protein
MRIVSTYSYISDFVIPTYDPRITYIPILIKPYLFTIYNVIFYSCNFVLFIVLFFFFVFNFSEISFFFFTSFYTQNRHFYNLVNFIFATINNFLLLFF